MLSIHGTGACGKHNSLKKQEKKKNSTLPLHSVYFAICVFLTYKLLLTSSEKQFVIFL